MVYNNLLMYGHMSKIRFTTNYKRSKHNLQQLLLCFFTVFLKKKIVCFDSNIVVLKPIGLQFHNSIVGVKRKKKKHCKIFSPNWSRQMAFLPESGSDRVCFLLKGSFFLLTFTNTCSKGDDDCCRLLLYK